MPIQSTLLGLFVLLCCSSAALAERGFTFVNDRVAVTVKPDDKLVSIPFEFENKTNRILTIARYDSACSCISARVTKPLGKMAYKPGEKGQITVDFELGSFSGVQEKTLMLWTKDDPAKYPSSVLTSAITIPELFKITPSTLIWDQNGSNESKSLKIKVTHDQPIHMINHMGTNPNFPYQIKTIRDGWEYEVVVTPQNVATPGMGILKFTTDSPIKRYQSPQAFVCVRRPVGKAIVKPKK